LNRNESERSVEDGCVRVGDQDREVGVSFVVVGPTSPAIQVLRVGNPPVRRRWGEDSYGRRGVDSRPSEDDYGGKSAEHDM